jgi:hypothetical protein
MPGKYFDQAMTGSSNTCLGFEVEDVPNFDGDTGYPGKFFLVLLTPCRKMPEKYLDQTTSISFQIFSKSLLENHPTI